MREIILKDNWVLCEKDNPEKSVTVEVPNCFKETEGFENCGDICVYKKTFSSDEINNSNRAFIYFGSVFRRACVFLNGRKLGYHDGYQSPFKFEISDFIKEGENLLEVEVDSGVKQGDLFGASCTPSFMPFHFDGITQPVKLQLADRIFAYELYTPVDWENGKALLICLVSSDVKETVTGTVSISLSHDGETLEFEKQTEFKNGENSVTIEIPLEKIRLWSPEEPVLYNAGVIVKTSFSNDIFSTKTGFRSFEIKGKDFILNGKPVYILGYGDDMIFPEKRPSATDGEFYAPGVKRAKEYGFIFARHHSNFPFECALEKYDELGLLIQPELAMANLVPEQFTEENSDIFISVWRELISAYRHHPCIAAWCGGNELEYDFPFSKELYKIAKELDPYRPVQTTDGIYSADDMNDTMDYAGIVPAEYTDYLPYREYDDMFTRDESAKPQVLHEMGNFTTIFNIYDMPRWEKAHYPCKRVIEMKKTVMENNKEVLYDKALKNSFSLQKLCHKYNMEKLRLSPNYSGYHFWTLNDYYETTQGLLNSFFEDKAFTPEEFRKFNSQCVLLFDTKTYSFSSEKKAKLKFKLSKYGSDDVFSGKITVDVGEFFTQTKDISFSGHGLFDAGEYEVTLPETDIEKQYTVKIKFEYSGNILENCWEIFNIPKINFSREKEIYIHYLSRHLFEKEKYPVKVMAVPQRLGENRLIVADKIFSGMLESVYYGSSMIAFLNEDTFKNTVTHNSFKTPWWDPGEIWYVNHTNNIQTSCVIEDHPATEFFPYRGAWKFDMFSVVEQAVAVDLDKLDFDVDEIIYGVDTKLHRLGYLFQFKFGKGKVLVCGFNHSRNDINDINVDYSVKSLVNYAMSDKFCPKAEVSAEKLLKLVGI